MHKNNVYCNPLNLEYSFSKFKNKKYLHREGADPTMVLFNDTYLLFVSMSGGFWHSQDLTSWTFKETKELSATDYAPDVCVIGEYVYYSASRFKPSTFYRTKDPINGKWEELTTPFPFWDPALFCDDDGRVYFYWGCDPKNPLYGIEMDINTMLPIGDKIELFNSNTSEHGWERQGDDNQGVKIKTPIDIIVRMMSKGRPYLEGAFMTKHNGKYYLQYAAPGAERNVYADGVYIAKTPLGPFEYQKHNPFSLKVGGFIQGAGHGSTFKDKNGNWWHCSTMTISLNDGMERRVGLFPAGFDEDDTLYCNTSFGDYPTLINKEKINPLKDVFAGTMLLSYNKKVIVSSTNKGTHSKNIVDENIKTIWSANEVDKEKYVILDLENELQLDYIQMNFFEQKCVLPKDYKCNYTGNIPFMNRDVLTTDNEMYDYDIAFSKDGKTYEEIINIKNNKPHNLIELSLKEKYRFIKIKSHKMPYNGLFTISGVRVFGVSQGAKPEKVINIVQEKNSPLDVKLSWDKIENAQGYNIRYGVEKDKLYSSKMVYANTNTLLTSLNLNTKYYFAIDSFNECGITKGDILALI